MNEPKSILDLFAFPEFVFRICSRSSQVLHACLELCTTTRIATLNLEQQLIKVHPNWGLSFILPNSKYYGLFETSINYAVINKEYLPTVDVKDKEWEAYGHLPEKPSELYDSAIGEALRCYDRVYLPKLTIVKRPQTKSNPGVDKIFNCSFLGFDLGQEETVNYYYSSCGNIYAKLSSDQSAILVERNFEQFIVEFFKCYLVLIYPRRMQVFGDLYFAKQLINNLPRFPSWKYDFCSNCGGGRCTHLEHDDGCFACKNCKYSLCNTCMNLGKALHPHKLHRVHNANDTWQNGVDKDFRYNRPVSSFFCEGCNCYLWRSPGHAYLCQHLDRAFCNECLANKQPQADDQCIFNIEYAYTSISCDVCHSYVHLYETVYSCKEYDVCQRCGPAGKLQHEAKAPGPHEWKEGLAFDEDCCRCYCYLRLDEVNWVCTSCFRDQWSCSDCSSEGCLSCRKPLTPYQNGRIYENP